MRQRKETYRQLALFKRGLLCQQHLNSKGQEVCKLINALLVREEKYKYIATDGGSLCCLVLGNSRCLSVSQSPARPLVKARCLILDH